MEKVRTRAIREIETFALDPVDKIILAVNHDVPAWLKPAYVELCQREDPIQEEEAVKLGLSTAMKLARAREYIRGSWVPPIRQRQVVPAPAPTHALGWNDINAEPAQTTRSVERRLDTALVEDVVTHIFWPPGGLG